MGDFPGFEMDSQRVWIHVFPFLAILPAEDPSNPQITAFEGLHDWSWFLAGCCLISFGKETWSPRSQGDCDFSCAFLCRVESVLVLYSLASSGLLSWSRKAAVLWRDVSGLPKLVPIGRVVSWQSGRPVIFRSGKLGKKPKSVGAFDAWRAVVFASVVYLWFWAKHVKFFPI